MKLKLLQRALSANNLDSILILNFDIIDPALFYFTGIELEKAALLIKRNTAELFVIKLEILRTQKESMVRNVKELKSIGDFAKEMKGTVGVNSSHISLSSAKNLQGHNIHLVNASKIISRLREVKTEEEISRIRKACSISDDIIEGCISEFRNFKTEGSAKNWLNRKAAEKGLELSFPTIVASGKNAAFPHYSGAEKLQKGFCVIDFGIKYKGYCSDTTRTIYLGTPQEEEKQLYNKVLFCQQETSNNAKTGKSMEQLENFSREILGNLSERFIHRLGHSVGIEVHDPLEKTTPLETGMVVTIEPGVYFENRLGIRIEDTILIKKKGPETLTEISKDLQIIS